MRDRFYPKAPTSDLDHAPKHRGPFVQVPEYIPYTGFTGARKYGRGEVMEVERGPRVRKLEIE